MTSKAEGKSNAQEMASKEIKALEKREEELNKEIKNKKS